MKNLIFTALVLVTISMIQISEGQDKECIPMDVAFIVDASSSIYKTDFDTYVKKFISDVIKSFKIGPDDTRVAMMTFAYRPFPQFYLNRRQRLRRILRAVEKAYYWGGVTNTHKALRFATRMLGRRFGGRNGVKKLAIVITDGKSRHYQKTIDNAKRLKDSGVTVMAIGMGRGTDMREIFDIASEPVTKFAYKIAEVKALETIEAEFIDSICPAEDESTTEDSPVVN